MNESGTRHAREQSCCVGFRRQMTLIRADLCASLERRRTMLFAVMSLPLKKENGLGLPGQDTMLSSVLAVASNFQQQRVHTEQSSFKVDRVDSRRPDLPGKSVAVPISMRRRETKRTRVNERRTGGMLHGAVEVAFKELRDAMIRASVAAFPSVTSPLQATCSVQILQVASLVVNSNGIAMKSVISHQEKLVSFQSTQVCRADCRVNVGGT